MRNNNRLLYIQSWSRKGLFLFLISLFLTVDYHPLSAVAATSDYVRTANYFLLSGTTLDDKATRETLMKYDLLVLPILAQDYNKDFLIEARKKNPDIILLAYVPTVSWNSVWDQHKIYQDFKKGIKSSWWLKDANGKQISIWPGTQALDLTGDWGTYLANWTVDTLLTNNYWDGVFYDEVSAEIDWIADVDLDRDGKADSAAVANEAWTQGLINLFSRTRGKIGTDKMIVMNGSSNTRLLPYVNGRMYESFPTPWESGGNWNTLTNRYIEQESKVSYDPIFVINGNTNNTGNSTDYQKMRFGLSTTLLSNGYFGFDFGDQNHGQAWYYDEYDIALGQPSEEAQQLSSGVWERDFEQGKTLVNPTTSTQTIKLDGDYEKISGTQDQKTNDGRITSSVSLPSEDGLILLRPLEKIIGSVYKNGAFVRIFNSDGDTERNGFFAYTSVAKGGSQVIEHDTDNDGKLEMVVAGDSRVDIYEDNGSLHASFYPYTDRYKLGINISIDDLEGDGTIEIVTGTENGGGPQMRIFNKDGVLIHPGFFAYDTAFRGGVNVTIGDLNGDGTKEIIAGAGVGGGPHVRVFNKDGKVINPGFFAFDPAFRGGVNVAAGDINGDGIEEIVTGPGKGGSPEIKVYTKDGVLLNSGFFAYDEDSRNGVEVSTSDVDNDGIDEIIAIGSDVFTLSLF